VGGSCYVDEGRKGAQDSTERIDRRERDQLEDPEEGGKMQLTMTSKLFHQCMLQPVHFHCSIN
jgi:hypothetical protein